MKMKNIAIELLNIAAGVAGSNGTVTLAKRLVDGIGDAIKGVKTPTGGLEVSCKELCLYCYGPDQSAPKKAEEVKHESFPAKGPDTTDGTEKKKFKKSKN